MINYLDWDSNFFEKKIGEFSISSEDDLNLECVEFDLVYVKQKEDFHVEIPNFKQSYSENKVVYSKKLSKSQIGLELNPIVSTFDVDFNIDVIYDLAFESGKHSRFKIDPNFTESGFKSLYKIWVDNSLKKEFADDLLLYLHDDVVCGFASYKIFENFATIGLIAVNPKIQGKGIGTKLLKTIENKLVELNICELRIPTQLQNVQACHFYSKLGYTIIDTTIIKHFWRS